MSKRIPHIKSSLSSLLPYLFAALLLWAGQLQAQPVLNARNSALGGGGTAYLTGSGAAFYNPANLAIYDRKGRLHLELGTAGLYFEPVLSSSNPSSQFTRLRDILMPHELTAQTISTSQRTAILEENYSGHKSLAEHMSRADALLGALVLKGDGKAYSLAVRSRMGSRIETGRGWYSTRPLEQNGKTTRNFSLLKQQQVLHEISIGYAQEFTFINGLIPRINKLYIGIAPKFIVAGAYEYARFDGRYSSDSQQGTPNFKRSFSYRSAGAYSRMINRYISAKDLGSAIQSELDPGFQLRPTGYGAGLDFGLSYVIPLGSDMSLLDEGGNRRPVQRTLRLGISMTDIGFVRYSSSPLELNAAETSTTINDQPPVESKFIGAPGQYPAFFEKASQIPNPFFQATDSSGNGFTTLLPTTINAGAVLDINRFRLMGDLTLGLQRSAFTNTKLTAHLGIESRPLPFLPIRFGTRLAAGKPISIGLGTGIETRHWDLSIASQILLKSSSLTSELVGGGVAALQFHF